MTRRERKEYEPGPRRESRDTSSLAPRPRTGPHLTSPGRQPRVGQKKRRPSPEGAAELSACGSVPCETGGTPIWRRKELRRQSHRRRTTRPITSTGGGRRRSPFLGSSRRRGRASFGGSGFLMGSKFDPQFNPTELNEVLTAPEGPEK